jgi:hypothetical protein
VKDDGAFVIKAGCFYVRCGRLSVIGFKDVRGMDVPLGNLSILRDIAGFYCARNADDCGFAPLHIPLLR